jgi:hypothetical protein
MKQIELMRGQTCRITDRNGNNRIVTIEKVETDSYIPIDDRKIRFIEEGKEPQSMYRSTFIERLEAIV